MTRKTEAIVAQLGHALAALSAVSYDDLVDHANTASDSDRSVVARLVREVTTEAAMVAYWSTDGASDAEDALLAHHAAHTSV